MNSIESMFPSFFATLTQVAMKATILLCLAGLLTVVLRRRSAALRHMIWTVALGASVAMFFLTAMLPAWRVIPMPVQSEVSAPAVESASPHFTDSSVAPASAKARPKYSAQRVIRPEPVPSISRKTGVETQTASVATRNISWQPIVIAIWALGVCFFLLRYGWNSWKLRNLFCESTWVTDPEWGERLLGMAARLGITRPVTLVNSDEVDVPLTWGVVHPRIFLPREAAEWSEDRFLAVLHHELAHIKRHDALTQSVAHAACSVFWFHPLMWYAARQMRFERERACDDYVLANGVTASEYATDLLAIVSSFGTAEKYPLALSMARRSQFEGRLLAVLDPRLDRDFLSLRKIALMIGTAALVAVPLAAMQGIDPNQARQTKAATAPPASGVVAPARLATESSPASTAQTVTTVTEGGPTLVPAELTTNAAVPDTGVTASSAELASTVQIRKPSNDKSGKNPDIFSGCSGKSSSNSNMSHTDDNGRRRWEASWIGSGCSFDMKSEGKVSFNKEFTAIESISSGGYMDINSNVNGDLTRLQIRPSSSGVTYTYTRNGKPYTFSRNGQSYEFSRNGKAEEFSLDGEVWLAQFLLGLDRMTAFAIEGRFPSLMAAGGAQRVLEEIGLMRTNHAKATYLLRLVNVANLNNDELRRTLMVAGELDSDYETARVLIAVATKYDLADASVKAAFLNATEKLSSDFEHARTLMAFLSKTNPNTDQVEIIVRSTANMGSDYERARVLVELASKNLLTSGNFPAYLKSVDQINSDYEHARTLVALLQNHGKDDFVAMGVVRSAGKIASDYEASRVLVAVANQRKIEGDLRVAYIRVGEAIKSDYERNRALAAVNRTGAAKY